MDVHTSGIERRARLPVPALIVFGTAASYALGYWLGQPWLVPVLNTVPALIALRASLQRGEMATAVTRMLLWAATLAICATLLSYSTPEQTGRLFLNGDRYRTEMFNWVLTGAGAESRPREFVPVHLAHASIFVLLSLVSGSILSLPMGAVLMNYMGHFVGALAAVSRRPVATMIAAWHPWSLVRIVSFVVLGVVLAGPVLSRVSGFRFRLADHTRWLWLAAGGLLLDIALKTALAPSWQRLLRGLVGW